MSQFLAAVCGPSATPARAGFLRSAYAAAAAALGTLAVWRSRDRDRRRLLELDERMLRDIGLTRTDVLAVASKPFWQA